MKRRLVLLIVCLVVCIGALVGGFFLLKERNSGPFPQHIHEAADSPLYYPFGLSNFSLVEDSFRVVENNVILFQFKHTSGDVINVSEQPKPDEFDFEEFYRENVDKTESQYTDIGKATYGNINRGSIISIETDQTWILINSLSPLSKDQLKQLADRFVQVN